MRESGDAGACDRRESVRIIAGVFTSAVSPSYARFGCLVGAATRRADQEETLMRRQYHSQLVGGRTLIWDVHRLVELTRDYSIQQIPLSRIHELDECFWFGDEPATCRAVTVHAKLIEETDLAYPIILSASGRVMDGMHRVCKALLKDMATVNAVQFTHDPEPDYVDADVKALPYEEP